MRTFLLLTALLLRCLCASADVFPGPDAEEQKVIDAAHVSSRVFARKNVVLAWPADKVDIPWEQGWSVQSVSDFADHADRLFELYASDGVFGYNPQKDPAAPGWARHRLVIAFFLGGDGKWSGCVEYGMTIQLCAPPGRGTRDWSGVLSHEMTHYFGALRFNAFGYTEGIADFMRYATNKLLGWNDIAANLRHVYYDSCYQDGLPTYHGAAGALIEAFERGGFPNVRAFIEHVRATRYETVFPPMWEFFSLTGMGRASAAYCRETRGLSHQIDPARVDRARTEVWDTLHGLIDLRDIANDLSHRQGAPATVARIPTIRRALESLRASQGWELKASFAVLAALGTSVKVDSDTVAQAQLETSAMLVHLAARAETILLDQPSSPKFAFAGDADPGATLAPGWESRAYKLPGGMSAIPPMPQSAPFNQGVLTRLRYLDLAQFQREIGPGLGGSFGIWTRGYLRVKTGGRYLLFLASDDGARLSVHGKELINNDGTHGRVSRIVDVALGPGIHPVALSYFTGGGEASLQLDVVPLEGAGDAEWIH